MGKTNQKKEYDYRYRNLQVNQEISQVQGSLREKSRPKQENLQGDLGPSAENFEISNENSQGFQDCGFIQDSMPDKNEDSQWKSGNAESSNRDSGAGNSDTLNSSTGNALHRHISLRNAAKRPPCGLHCIKMTDIGVKAGKSVIIEHVNLHIHCGRLTVIIGRNGAGKSTLIKAILGEIRHSGTVEFRDMRDRSIQDLRIGYVPQHLNIEKNTPTSVYDMFASYISNVPVFLRKSRKLKRKIANSLALFQAQDLIDKQLCDLSGGELQRVLLSIACEPVPNLLLLDEPVSGIDRNGMELFYHNLAMLKKNYDLAMVLVSHDLDFVAKYADNVILLDRTVIKEGTPEQVFTSAAFKEIFGNGYRL